MRGIVITAWLLAACGSTQERPPAAPPANDNVQAALDAYNAGLDAAARGDFSTAIENYTRALTYDASFPHAYAARAIAYSRSHRDTEAEADYGRAIESAGERSGKWHYVRARWHHEGGRLDQAERDYTEALAVLQRAPDNSLLETYLHRALLYYDTNRPSEAAADWRAALALNPDEGTASEIRRWLGQVEGR